METIERCLFFSEWARATWFSSSLSARIEKLGFSRFDYWCDEDFSSVSFLNREEKALTAWVGWSIWKSRCSMVFEGRLVDPIVTVMMAED